MISLMNVERQYKSIEQELDKAALSVLHSGKYIMGENVVEFEKEFAYYCGTKYAIGVGNGTDALVIALMAAGIGQGDEVITSAMSFYATAEAIANVGATPVFVDINKDTFTIDAKKIEEKVTSNTKAIIPVHLYGQCADMDFVNAIAEKFGLIVIEDCAQAAGATYKGKRAGSLADIGCFSFFPTKNLGCAGDGGIIVTDSEDIYRKCCAYRVHGSGRNGEYAFQSKNNLELKESDFGDNLPKYFNFIVGFNSRLDALQAAILRVKLPYLEKWNERRRVIAQRYYDEINSSKITKPLVEAVNLHIFYVYVITVDNRADFRNYMKERGVETGVYFPVPLHLQKVFAYLGYKKGDMPNAEYLAEHGVAIPMFPELTESEIDTIIESVSNY